MKNLNEEVNKIKHLFNFKSDVITEDSGIDYEGITIGDTQYNEGDVYDILLGLKVQLIEIDLGLEDNIKDYESLFSDFSLEKCMMVKLKNFHLTLLYLLRNKETLYF